MRMSEGEGKTKGRGGGGLINRGQNILAMVDN